MEDNIECHSDVYYVMALNKYMLGSWHSVELKRRNAPASHDLYHPHNRQLFGHTLGGPYQVQTNAPMGEEVCHSGLTKKLGLGAKWLRHGCWTGEAVCRRLIWQLCDGHARRDCLLVPYVHSYE